MKILVIDDEPALRATVRRMLEAAGHSVIEAENGRAGLRLFHAEAMDAVITDIIMPEQEGVETIRQIRALHPTTRIIAMSGGSRTGNLDYLKMAKTLGADATLAKPFRQQDLLALVDQAYAG